jgi:hypothetical protein
LVGEKELKRIIKNWLMILISGTLIASAILTALPTPAYAASYTITSASTKKTDAALEKQFHARKVFQRTQANRLLSADKLIEEAQHKIESYQNRGIDASSLVNALATFQTRLADAQALHDSATVVIDTHAGFGGSSEVTNIPLARQTLKTITSDQNSSGTILTKALNQFNKVFTNFQGENRK